MSLTAGEKLAKYLQRANLQQRDLAQALEIEPSYVSRMVKDHIKWTNGKYFGQIAAFLCLSEEEIRDLNPAVVVEFRFPEWAQILKKRREEILGAQANLIVKGKFFRPFIIERLERGDIHPAEIKPEQFARILKLLEWTPEVFARLTDIEVDLSGIRSIFTEGEQLGLYLERAQVTRQRLAKLLGVDLPYITKLIEDRVSWIDSEYFKQIAEILCLTDVEIETLKEPDRSQVHKDVPRPPTPSPELDEMFSKYMAINKELRAPAWRNFLASMKTKVTNTADDWYILFLKLKSMGIEPE